jgi:hypothetical protein
MYAKFLGLRASIKQAMCCFLQRAQVAAALECHLNTRSRVSEFGVMEILTILDRLLLYGSVAVALIFVPSGVTMCCLAIRVQCREWFCPAAYRGARHIFPQSVAAPFSQVRASHAARGSSSLPRSHSLLRYATALTSICRTFMTKEATLCHALVKYLLRFWPVSSEKVLVFLSTLKDAIVFLATMAPLESRAVKELMVRGLGRAWAGTFVQPLRIAPLAFLTLGRCSQSKDAIQAGGCSSSMAFELTFNATGHG